MAKAQENLKRMQEQMSQIQKASDPAQRQKLMQEHQTMMQQGMHTMNGMRGGGMMGCCGGGMPGGHMMGDGQMMRSEEHTSELQSLMSSSYAVICLTKNK